MVSKKIREYAPAAIQHVCIQCKVPLPYLLDVGISASVGMTSSQGGVSHEASALSCAPLFMTGKSKHKIDLSLKAAVSSVDHITKNQLDSVTLQWMGSVRFADFHLFLTSLPESVLRVKGFLFFAHDLNYKWQYHFSGRKRHDFSRELWSVGDVKMSHFIIIGTAIDKQMIQQKWEKITSGSIQNRSLDAIQIWNSLVETHLQFDSFPIEFASISLDPDLFYFRLTGSRYFQFSLAELRMRGIDIDGMNEQLVSAVNTVGGSNLALVISSLVNEPLNEYLNPGSKWICVANTIGDDDPTSPATIFNRFNVILHEASKILDFVFKHVHHCRCAQ